MKKILPIIILSVLVLSVGLIAKNIVSDFKSEVTKNDNQPPEEKEYKDIEKGY